MDAVSEWTVFFWHPPLGWSASNAGPTSDSDNQTVLDFNQKLESNQVAQQIAGGQAIDRGF